MPASADFSAPVAQVPVLNLDAKIAQFKADVEAHISKYDPARVIVVSAWLVSDNVIIDLFRRHTNIFPTVVGVDTLHIFPETFQTIKDAENKYNFTAKIYKPKGCETLEDFNRIYGRHEILTNADFDKHSKVDPLILAFEDLKKEVAVTGRRADQGNARAELAVWEEDKKTFNPLADWSWDEVASYVLQNDVPYISLHRRLLVSDVPIKAINRDTFQGFRTVELDRPYFAYPAEFIRSQGPNVYVWKSFGDTHTSVAVEVHESERSGRFVGRLQTECGIHTRVAGKGAPHGGVLVDLVVPEAESNANLATKTLELNERQVCDFELLAVGGFSPLTGFMTETQYNTVVEEHRLPEGQLFGLPVVLDTDREDIAVGDYVLLTSTEFGARGVIKVESKWIPDRRREALKCHGTESEEHPANQHIYNERNKFNIGGRVWATKLPTRDWVTCKTPRQVRAEKTRQNMVAFQSRNPLHKAHATMVIKVAQDYDADVLVHPVIGPTKFDDIPAKWRKLTYDVLEKKISNVRFDYLPYSMMVAGPREALQHALIRKNYGCTHMIVGRDHAGCKDAKGKDFYGPYDAQDFMTPLQKELGLEIVPFHAMVFVDELNEYVAEEIAKEKSFKPLNISGTQFRKMLASGDDIPEWFAYPEVVSILREYVRTTDAMA
eukprot:Opistho-2@82764